MLYTDKEEIKLQYHSQLNELMSQVRKAIVFNLLNAELNPIRHLLALVGARHIVHVSRIMVNIVIKKKYWHASFVQSNEREISCFRDIECSLLNKE